MAEYRGYLHNSNQFLFFGFDHYQMSEVLTIFNKKMERISKYIVFLLLFSFSSL